MSSLDVGALTDFMAVARFLTLTLTPTLTLYPCPYSTAAPNPH